MGAEIKNQRIHWVDIAKGLAMILVIVGHTLTVPDKIVHTIYLFHMPAFFLLSGYCFSAKRKLKSFVWVKVKTVLLPVITLGMSGSLIVALLMKFLMHKSVNWQAVFVNPFIQCGERDLDWFLPAIFVSLLVFYGLVKLLKDKLVFLNISSFALAFLSYLFIKKVGVDVPWHVDTALVALPFVSIGYSLRKSSLLDKMKNISGALVFAVLCAGFGETNTILFDTVEMRVNWYGNIFLFYLSAISGCLMLIYISRIISESKCLEFIGKNTIIFYSFETIQYFFNFILKTVCGISTVFSLWYIKAPLTVVAIIGIIVCYSILAMLIDKICPQIVGKSKSKNIN